MIPAAVLPASCVIIMAVRRFACPASPARPMMDGPVLAPEARLLARGVARWLDRQGWRTLTEFPLSSGRRVDLMAVDEAGRFLIVEIKTTAGDYRADRKWRE